MINRAFLSASIVTALAATCSAQRTVRITTEPTLMLPVRQIGAEFKKLFRDAATEFVIRNQASVILGPPDMHPSGRSRRLFAVDRIVLVAPADQTRITKFSHLGLNLKFATLASNTPEGKLTNHLIEEARRVYGRDWSTNSKRNAKVSAADSSDGVRLVLEGKADAALALSSDARAHTAKLRIIPVPPDMARAVEHYASSRGRSLDRAFVDFLFSKGNQQRLVAAGFASPISPVPELAITMPGSMIKLFTSALGTHHQETVRITGQQGKSVSLSGASLRSILSKARGQVRFIGADGSMLKVPMSSIRQRGGVLAPMGDGNYQVVLPGSPLSQALRWVRKIEVE